MVEPQAAQPRKPGLSGHPWWVFSVAMFLAGLVILPLGAGLVGLDGVISAGVAFAVCFAAGLLAMGIVFCFPSSEQVVYQVLLGMLPRMGLPLIACMVIYFLQRPLFEAGFVYYILAFYFVMLAVETILMAGQMPNRTADTQQGTSP